MGVVYSAFDNLVNEDIALKFMNPRLLHTQRGQRLFIQEAQFARRLRHEAIVAVHDVGTTPEGILYLTMELLRGRSLRSFLRERRKTKTLLDIRFCVGVILQVLAALERAHRIIVHRDMKPENVMLVAGERIKVLDFGLAKARDEQEMLLPPQGAGPQRALGTMAYAAPEQVAHRDVDRRADIFSVGLILRELLTLRTPIDEAVALERVRDDVSPSLMSVLEKSLHPDKASRWQSAGDFKRALLAAWQESYTTREAAVLRESTGRHVSTEGMIYLEGGQFLMGNDASPDESPQFETESEPFYMDIYPVTNSQYDAFLKATGHREPKYWRKRGFDGENQPVVGVTWKDATAYAEWCGKVLPTETHWEYAARGKDDRKYPWGDHDPDATLANYGDYLNMPSVVDMHEDGKTPDGIFDLAGNVYEWTSTPYASYEQLQKGDAAKLNGVRMVVRGGSWHSDASELRCSFRKGLFVESEFSTVGFRCVVPAGKARRSDLPDPAAPSLESKFDA
jgi:formylglycine-generating enzyme required for sulfatase activity/tRNA A-37 threonylcarbamoyl transferase component Bud32